jgi:hypothetical protein
MSLMIGMASAILVIMPRRPRDLGRIGRGFLKRTFLEWETLYFEFPILFCL